MNPTVNGDTVVEVWEQCQNYEVVAERLSMNKIAVYKALQRHGIFTAAPNKRWTKAEDAFLKKAVNSSAVLAYAFSIFWKKYPERRTYCAFGARARLLRHRGVKLKEYPGGWGSYSLKTRIEREVAAAEIRKRRQSA